MLAFNNTTLAFPLHCLQPLWSLARCSLWTSFVQIFPTLVFAYLFLRCLRSIFDCLSACSRRFSRCSLSVDAHLCSLVAGLCKVSFVHEIFWTSFVVVVVMLVLVWRFHCQRLRDQFCEGLFALCLCVKKKFECALIFLHHSSLFHTSIRAH